MTYRWILRSLDDAAVVSVLQEELNGLPEALARALALRNVSSFEEARHFFRADRDALHDPFLMKDMDVAADRVSEAVEQGETVLVYGDYDVDGTTASALMADFLRSQGVDAHVFIPDRYEDGYGLGSRGLEGARDLGAGLVIALDCGITAMDEAAYAHKLGLDLIICDHHTPKAKLPEAVAVLDPKRTDCEYPFKELSGCGVGFKLVQATLERLGQSPDAAFGYLDLLAVSTASDIVPLYGENRVLMAEGLRVLQEKEQVRPGLRAMAETADLDLADVTSTGKIVFTIGPRINAAGRMAQADLAVDLLLAPDVDTALPMARELEELNRERREINDQIEQEAIQKAERHITSRTPHGLVLYKPDWHLGIIGIVASSVVEHFHKPAILLARNGDEVKGSARSISGVNVYDALSDCEDVLTQFGGHDYAAGMSLPEDRVDAFRDAFDEAVGRRITAEMLTPAIKVDASMPLEILGAHEDRFWAVLRQFGPHGPANATPVFHSDNLAVDGKPRTVGRDGNHLKFQVRDAASDGGRSYDVIGFGMGNKLNVVREGFDHNWPIELLYSVEENTWNGRTTLQLKCRDVRLQHKSDGLQRGEGVKG
ncbi:single-stranded-DNA-specific exonuclease RecJ [Longibacter sp.]|uniref:single-stranded-DNA-specific exonuclease RecJ n=1 Tax=Longibacter sp. TaxID=2045415 RepID=UPI003EC00713